MEFYECYCLLVMGIPQQRVHFPHEGPIKRVFDGPYILIMTMLTPWLSDNVKSLPPVPEYHSRLDQVAMIMELYIWHTVDS